MGDDVYRESKAIGMISSVAGSFFLLKAAKSQFELRKCSASSPEYKAISFKRDVYLAAGASFKLSSLLIMIPHIAKCYNPIRSLVALEGGSALLAAGIIFLEDAYRYHNELELKPWRKCKRDEMLGAGILLAIGGVTIPYVAYCADEDI